MPVALFRSGESTEWAHTITAMTTLSILKDKFTMSQHATYLLGGLPQFSKCSPGYEEKQPASLPCLQEKSSPDGPMQLLTCFPCSESSHTGFSLVNSPCIKVGLRIWRQRSQASRFGPATLDGFGSTTTLSPAQVDLSGKSLLKDSSTMAAMLRRKILTAVYIFCFIM